VSEADVVPGAAAGRRDLIRTIPHSQMWRPHRLAAVVAEVEVDEQAVEEMLLLRLRIR
jgi:hypothetical protein